jgi:hypothetical protein
VGWGSLPEVCQCLLHAMQRGGRMLTSDLLKITERPKQLLIKLLGI